MMGSFVLTKRFIAFESLIVSSDLEYDVPNSEVNSLERYAPEMNLMSACLDGLNQCFDLMGSLVFIALGIFFAGKGITTIDTLAAIYVLYGTMVWNFLQVGIYIPSMANYLANAKRVFEFLDFEEEKNAGNQKEHQNFMKLEEAPEL